MAKGNNKPATKGRPFPKGKSGNPGGVSKAVKEIRDMCREMGPELITELYAIAKNGSSDHKIQAIKELLNRGYGRSEHVTTIRLDRFATLTMAELDARIAELEGGS